MPDASPPSDAEDTVVAVDERCQDSPQKEIARVREDPRTAHTMEEGIVRLPVALTLRRRLPGCSMSSSALPEIVRPIQCGPCSRRVTLLEEGRWATTYR